MEECNMDQGFEMTNDQIIGMGQEYVMNTYARLPFALVKGEGSTVWDADGKRYIDMVAGIAVNNLGHCHPKVVAAIREQAGKLIHCSNLYWIEPQVKLAELICQNSCGTKAFFCNSGAEANEGAIKLARKKSYLKYGSGRHEIITAHHSFHGRTLAALTATGQPKYQQGFAPLPEGFKYVPYNDLEALEQAVTPQTCAIMLEPLQGEGGVYPAAREYLAKARELCDKHDMLLILDEVQTGLGRTGKLFAYQHYGIEPDVFTLAKGLGGGMPIGALVAKGEAAQTFKPGDHASTFGGNPLAAAAACAALLAIIEEKLPEQAESKGQYLVKKFSELKKSCPIIVDIRGMGLLFGAELSIDGGEIMQKCLERGLIVNLVQHKVLRLVPPLNVSYQQLDEAVSIIESCI